MCLCVYTHILVKKLNRWSESVPITIMIYNGNERKIKTNEISHVLYILRKRYIFNIKLMITV